MRLFTRYKYTLEYEEDGQLHTEEIVTPHNELQALARFKRKHKRAVNIKITSRLRSTLPKGAL